MSLSELCVLVNHSLSVVRPRKAESAVPTNRLIRFFLFKSQTINQEVICAFSSFSENSFFCIPGVGGGVLHGPVGKMLIVGLFYAVFPVQPEPETLGAIVNLNSRPFRYFEFDVTYRALHDLTSLFFLGL